MIKELASVTQLVYPLLLTVQCCRFVLLALLGSLLNAIVGFLQGQHIIMVPKWSSSNVTEDEAWKPTELSMSSCSRRTMTLAKGGVSVINASQCRQSCSYNARSR